VRTAEWANDTLTNDQASSDEQMRQYFLNNGLTYEQTQRLIELRPQFLSGDLYSAIDGSPLTETVKKIVGQPGVQANIPAPNLPPQTQTLLEAARAKIPNLDEVSVLANAQRISELGGDKQILPQYLAEALQYATPNPDASKITPERLFSKEGGLETYKRMKEVGITGLEPDLPEAVDSIRAKLKSLPEPSKDLLKMAADKYLVDDNGMLAGRDIAKLSVMLDSAASIAKSYRKTKIEPADLAEALSKGMGDFQGSYDRPKYHY
jgi:hypothetical protein